MTTLPVVSRHSEKSGLSLLPLPPKTNDSRKKKKKRKLFHAYSLSASLFVCVWKRVAWTSRGNHFSFPVNSFFLLFLFLSGPLLITSLWLMCENDLLSCHIHTDNLGRERRTWETRGTTTTKSPHCCHTIRVTTLAGKKEWQTRSEIIWKKRLRNRYITSHNVGRKAKKKKGYLENW